MKESYGEGVANHTGPESCVGFPRGGGEALTGVRAGQGRQYWTCRHRETRSDPARRGHPGVEYNFAAQSLVTGLRFAVSVASKTENTMPAMPQPQDRGSCNRKTQEESIFQSG